MRVAALDLGTNALRLLVSDVDGVRASDVLREMRIVRLGEGVDRTGRLSAAALARTRPVLVEYGRRCREVGVERTRMVATSASRDATNRADLVAMVRATIGVEPEVLSGEQEAALSFAGATRGLSTGAPDGAAPPYLIVDIGGGSTELVLGSGHVRAACSVDVGCVRLTERHLHDDPPTEAQLADATADVRAGLRQAQEQVPVQEAVTLVGLAGSVTTVAALALELDAYDAAQLHHARVAVDAVRATTERLLRMSRAQRAALPVMHPGRADVIGGGALVLRLVLDELGFDEVLVSEHDILDGVAWSLADGLAAGGGSTPGPS